MDIYLNSEILEVVEIVKKSNSAMFKTLRVGDRVCFSLALKPVGTRMHGSTYAPTIECTNIETMETVKKTLNQLKMLDCFVFDLAKPELC